MEWQKQSQKHAKLKEKFNQLLGAVRTEKEARTVATAARADSTLESTTAKSSSTPAGQAAVVDSGRPLFALIGLPAGCAYADVAVRAFTITEYDLFAPQPSR